MVKRAMVCVLFTVLGALLGSGTLMAAPEAGRLPHDDFQELLRYQVMGPEADVPEREYVFLTIGPLGDAERAELAAAGLVLKSTMGTTSVIAGPLTAFADLGPVDQMDQGELVPFSWVRAIYPSVPDQTFAPSREARPRSVDEMLQAIGADQVHEMGATGKGVTVGIIDPEFTGWAGREYGADRVTYLAIEYGPDGAPQSVVSLPFNHPRLSWFEGNGWAHGELCAEAVHAVAPGASLVLMWTLYPQDRQFFLQEIAAGNIQIDVLSNSSESIIPQDHGDGRGRLAQTADSVVESGVFYSYALGNYASGEEAFCSFYRAPFADEEGDGFHDFTPGATDYLDRNSLAITLLPWDKSLQSSVYLRVILAWDGWEYQVRDPDDVGQPTRWSESEYVSVQDIDMYLSVKAGSPVQRVGKSIRNQLAFVYPWAALASGEYSVPPIEDIFLDRITEPGTYLVQIENTTLKHPHPLSRQRHVELRMYIYTNSPAGIVMEHHNADGALINVGGARLVTGVGAMEGYDCEEDTGTCWEPASYSSQGPTSDGRMKPDLSGPSRFESEVTFGYGFCRFAYFDGTSAATPVVAGVAALMLEANPSLTGLEIRKALSDTAHLCSAGDSNYVVGCGLVNAKAAVARAIAMLEREPSPPEESNQTGNDGG